MTESEIMKALECCSNQNGFNGELCESECPYKNRCYDKEKDIDFLRDVIDLINRKNAEIERWKKNCDELYEQMSERQKAEVEIAKRIGRAEAIKEVFAKVDETLKRYSNLHKYAEKARHSTEEYADGTPMEMVSVWEVLSLKKWEMADYENMIQLQENIETISKARLLEEIEKDFRLLAKEMGVEL